MDFEFVLIVRSAVIRLHNSLNSNGTHINILINIQLCDLLHIRSYLTVWCKEHEQEEKISVAPRLLPVA